MPPLPMLRALIAALLIAVLPLPYGYYELLRLVACGLSSWAAWGSWQVGLQNRAGCWGLLALIYNPIVPVHLDKPTWIVINLASAVAIGCLLRRPADQT